MNREVLYGFDHDGVLNNVSVDRQNYLESFLWFFEQKTGIPQDEARRLFTEAHTDIAAHPENHMFWMNGFPVSPPSDHIIKVRACGFYALAAWSNQEPHRGLPHKDTWGDLLSETYIQAYEHAGVTYDDDTKKVILDLFPWFAIISGADDVKQRKNLKKLLAGTAIDVFDIPMAGNAGKSYVDPAWSEVPESVRIDEYPFPIYLRKPKYDAAFRSFRYPVGGMVSDAAILDLTFPTYRFNIPTVLKITDDTSAWEKDQYANHPSGVAVNTLIEARNALEILMRERR